MAPRILLLNDEPRGLQLLRRILRLDHIDTAVDEREVLSHLSRASYDLVIALLIGRDRLADGFLDGVRQAAPELPVFVLAGDATQLDTIADDPSVTCLVRPFAPTTVRAIVARLIDDGR